MKLVSHQIRLSATDLSNHLACRHLTSLDLQLTRGQRPAPDWASPDAKIIQELGLRHEQAFLSHLQTQGLVVENLGNIQHHEELLLQQQTLALMERGAQVIVQGGLGSERWFGRPDVLRRVETPSQKWLWSYEVLDTKLARETKSTTILQLSLYSDLLRQIQGTLPEFLWVVPPGAGFPGEKYRVSEYAAYYRHVQKRLLEAVSAIPQEQSYPQPVEHCGVCRWFRACDQTRRADDHLSLVAGIRRQQRDQFEAWGVPTMAKLAAFPIPLQQRPQHGAKQGYEHAREQARVQVQGRSESKLVFERRSPVEDGMGFCRLPEPSNQDLFVDLEGDPFVGDSGLQYLFGFAFHDAQGELQYEKCWALNRQEERVGFEWLVDEIMRRRAANPQMHVYHFGAYEPAAFKRLMGMYATREDEIDRMLRAGMLVDLHQSFKQAIRASVEEYSLKKIEAFYQFQRQTPLDESRAAMRYVEHRLELGWGHQDLPDTFRNSLEGYNRDDCLSTAALRHWLEQQRQNAVDSGLSVPRFIDRPEQPSPEADEQQERVAKLFATLTDHLPADPSERTREQQATWLLANLLDWHRREDKAAFWEGFRLQELDDQDLLEDRAGLSGLTFLRTLRLERNLPVDGYAFEAQETEARAGDELFWRGEKLGSVAAIDLQKRTVDIKKTARTASQHTKAAYLWDFPFRVEDQKKALLRLGDWVAKNGIDAPGEYRAARDLLLRNPPRLRNSETLRQLASETPVDTANRILRALENSTFAVQGPPGSGKTYTGARMICELVQRGLRVGITALSHKVIRKLLDDVVTAAIERNIAGIRCMHRDRNGEQGDGVAVAKKSNGQALDALRSGQTNVLGGVSWLWADEAAFQSVDVLIVDEAGQMSLADVLAVSQAGRSLVLLGDPQQLDRPLRGTHPDGAEKSALEHLLDGQKTVLPHIGFLLPQTWRLHPQICEFTSEAFYESKLGSHPMARRRVLEGHAWLTGAGLWFLPVVHEGNRNSSAEEVDAITRIVDSLLQPEVRWFYSAGNSRSLKAEDILIVAPYNVQVAELSARLPADVSIGTVDKFQGQEAAIAIYSLTTSSPEDAPGAWSSYTA